MKKDVKNFLYKLKIYHYLDFFRRFSEIINWINNGCSGIAPAPIKRKILFSYINRFHIKTFVETGTYEGDTLAYIASKGMTKCISVELSKDYFNKANKRFLNDKTVNLFCGDSGMVIPEIVSKLNEPALFWLDGHYSGAKTAKGESETPIFKEVEAIFSSPIKNHVILVDDIRCFNGENDYPKLDEFIRFIQEKSSYRVEISADILRLTS